MVCAAQVLQVVRIQWHAALADWNDMIHFFAKPDITVKLTLPAERMLIAVPGAQILPGHRVIERVVLLLILFLLVCRATRVSPAWDEFRAAGLKAWF